MNKKGDIEYPFLRPFVALKGSVCSPLTTVVQFTLMIHSITHAVNLIGKPNSDISCSKQIHLTKSQTFCRSILIMHLGDTQFLVYALINSWAMMILSHIFLPGINPSWESYIILSITFSILVVSTLEIYLYSSV